MGELIYLTRRQDDDAVVSGALDVRTSLGGVQPLLDSIERPLAEAVAQAASLATKFEELRKCLDGSPEASMPLDACMLALMRRNANSSRERLLKSARELTRLRDLFARQAAIEQDS